MERIVICGISMRDKIEPAVYESNDRSIPASKRSVCYPINAFLEKALNKEDSLKLVLLIKKDPFGNYKKNLDIFKKEFESVNNSIGAPVSYEIIDTEFSEEKDIHDLLMGKLVDALDIGAHIWVDTTYGPKDLPIVIFTALNFAEKFLECQVDSIIYGKADFENGKPVNTKMCDMVSLYYLGSITNTIHCVEPEKAKEMLKSLLSL